MIQDRGPQWQELLPHRAVHRLEATTPEVAVARVQTGSHEECDTGGLPTVPARNVSFEFFPHKYVDRIFDKVPERRSHLLSKCPVRIHLEGLDCRTHLSTLQGNEIE